MKDIKKYMTAVAAAALVMVVSAPGHTFTTQGTPQTLTASATTGGAAVISIASAQIKTISGNAIVGAIGWTNPTTGWKVADQYIELKTNITTVSGGVQIYTDNVNGTGNTQFTGVISNVTPTPAGLVNTVSQTQKLPTAWRASASTIAVTAVDPNTDPAFAWFFHEDKSQVAVPSLGASNFNNADAYITVFAAPGTLLGGQTTPTSGGVHFGQDPKDFGGFSTNATTLIYTEADFSSALAQTTYSTTKLILEAFSL
jgi:hypothetical protein